MSKTRKRMVFGALALTAICLVGCAAPAPPAPAPRRDDFYIEKETYRPRKPKPPETATPKTPSAAPASVPASVAVPAVEPDTPAQLPPAAQSPATVPPAGGLPHDASQYIEPPSR